MKVWPPMLYFGFNPSDQRVQTVKMVHACSVSIAPLNVDSVPTNGLDLGGSNAGVQGLSFQGTLARHLIHTGGTRALETQVEVGEGEFLSRIKT